MDLENLIEKYNNVSREEFEKIRETSQYPTFSQNVFECLVRMLHRRRKHEKKYGRESILAGPLVQVISVQVLPDVIDQNKPLTIYGRIYAEFRDTTSGEKIVHDLYNRKCDNAEVLGPSGTLTLISPDCSSWPLDICMSFPNTRLVVDVCAGEYVHGEAGALAMRYISMPLAVYGHVRLLFTPKQSNILDEENHPSLNVKGKIVARFGIIFGSHASEEYTLFEKQSNEFERVDLSPRKRMGGMRLSRGWVGVPAYSSLILDLDLSEFGTERKILKETVELRVENGLVSGDKFIVDDILISVRVGWHSPRPRGRCTEEVCGIELEDESSSDEIPPQETTKEESDEQMIEACVPEASSNTRPPWFLRAHQNSRAEFKAMQVYGSIEVSSSACTFDVFKREAKDAFVLSEHSKTLPVIDGFRVYDDCDSLEVKIDLKDVENCLCIRGYIEWDWEVRDNGSLCLDNQLCSIVQGEQCFAAIHYTVFSEAVQANIDVLYIPKSEHVDVHPKVYGSLIAQYNNYDYISQYNKDNYRIVLFQRNQENPAQPGNNGMIALSRSVVAVPVKSSLIIEANLWNGISDQVLSFSTKFRIGASSDSMTMEGDGYSININLKWGEM
ncbi:Ribosomal protein S6 kinase delta-1 [Bienertia sinuspersici]